jgi:hypothetical protein
MHRSAVPRWVATRRHFEAGGRLFELQLLSDGDVDECYDEADPADSCSYFDQVLREEFWVRKCTDIVYF